ncbi:XRE family transcriptional regulator [Paenochrobactrum pullorum]|uniref:XRE family transcriptional regulator n=1 Tax=Paenochrobactrum pullorum TaxID=1324351 RepID=UPI0035BC4DA9
MNDFRQWLKDGMERTGITQSELGRRVGKPANYINKIFTEGRKIGLEEYVVFANALGESPINIPIPIVGKVGAGDHIYGMDNGILGEIENQGGMYPIGTKGVEVEGTSMGEDIPDGSIIFYDDEYEVPQSFHINCRCVVWTYDGRTMVKKLLRGSRPDRWNLFSYGSGTAEPDVVLDRVAKVTGVKYR